MALIEIPISLRKLTGNTSEIEVHADNVQKAFDFLFEKYPDLISGLEISGGRIPPYVNIYKDGEDIRYLRSWETALSKESKISILVALAGG